MSEIMELPYKLAFSFVDTDNSRNHEGVSQILLHEDRVMLESITNCDFYDTDDYSKPPIPNHPYYLRQQFKRERVSGVVLQSCYHQEIKTTIYIVEFNIVGSQDDVRVPFRERKEALAFYKIAVQWVFQKED